MNKFDSLNEMDKFFERHKLQKLTQQELGIINSLIQMKYTEFFIAILPALIKLQPTWYLW